MSCKLMTTLLKILKLLLGENTQEKGGIAFPYADGFSLLPEFFTTLYNIIKFIIAINNIGILL